MLHEFKRALISAYGRLRRPPRRIAPSLFGLEKRTLLSARVVENEAPTERAEAQAAAKVNKQVAFVNGLYQTYFHGAPEPAQLNFIVAKLNAGVSQTAIKNDFANVVSTNAKKVSASAFVNGLYTTIGARSPSANGEAYWLGMSKSGMTRTQVLRTFRNTNGLLPAPVITWDSPSSIYYGIPLGVAELNAQANVAGYFTYSPAAGTIPYAFGNTPLTTVFTPIDSADYAPVVASVNIDVFASTPTIVWHRPQAIMYGTPLGDTQLNATATAIFDGQTVDIPGTFTYSYPAGTVLTVGTNLSLAVVFRPFDDLDYATVVKAQNITVTFGPPPPTPTPTPPPPTPTYSPTPAPTPYPTPGYPSPTPVPYPTPNGGIGYDGFSRRASAPTTTPPPTPFDMVLPASSGNPGDSITIPRFLANPQGPADEPLTPTPDEPVASLSPSLVTVSIRKFNVPISYEIEHPNPPSTRSSEEMG